MLHPPSPTLHPPPRRETTTKRHTGFTLIELLVVVAIIGILATLLFPAFARARENGRRIGCASNLRQVGLGLTQYMQDYNERFPPYFSQPGGATPYTKTDGTQIPSAVDHGGFKDLIQPYVKSEQAFVCPSDRGHDKDPRPFKTMTEWNYTSLFFNGYTSAPGGDKGLAGHKLSSVGETTRVVMAAEGSVFGPFSWHLREQSGHMYNGARSNVCFVDGHVKFVRIYQTGTDNSAKYDPPAGYEYRWTRK